MSANTRSSIAIAEERIRKVAGAVARQRMLIASLTLAGQSTASQVTFLRLYEANLVLFEEALARLKEPFPVPLPPRC